MTFRVVCRIGQIFGFCCHEVVDGVGKGLGAAEDDEDPLGPRGVREYDIAARAGVK